MEKKEKIVFILGAGFSKYSDYPLQNEILRKLNIFYSSENITKESKDNWKKILTFFKDCIGNNIESFLIEDLFTILDKCISDGESFKQYNLVKLEDIKLSLIMCIRDYFNQLTTDKMTEQINNQKYPLLKDFSDLILQFRDKNNSEDLLSIISLNWDCLLEKFLQYYSVNYTNILLDYCTFDYSFNNNKTIPSILKKTAGFKNLKILKAHGSTNWGYCQNCKRLYISFGKKMNSKEGHESQNYECIKYCNKLYKHVRLSPVLITPTFLKNMGNYHIQNIWSNMGIELSEASTIIIIGYSLRAEDFYFRFLLSKYINKSTKLKIFDYEPDSTKTATTKTYVEKKFQDFFQGIQPINIEVNVDGWTNCLKNIKDTLKLTNETAHNSD